jgi:hypothetical protein
MIVYGHGNSCFIVLFPFRFFQTVIPLNETNGIIEWLDNLQPLRGILVPGINAMILYVFSQKNAKHIDKDDFM